MSKTTTPPPKPKPKRTSPAELPPGVNALLSPQQVAAALSKSVREFRRLRTTERFPPPDSPDGERPRWKTSTVNAWIEKEYSRGVRVPQA